MSHGQFNAKIWRCQYFNFQPWYKGSIFHKYISVWVSKLLVYFSLVSQNLEGRAPIRASFKHTALCFSWSYYLQKFLCVVNRIDILLKWSTTVASICSSARWFYVYKAKNIIFFMIIYCKRWWNFFLLISIFNFQINQILWSNVATAVC